MEVISVAEELVKEAESDLRKIGQNPRERYLVACACLGKLSKKFAEADWISALATALKAHDAL